MQLNTNLFSFHLLTFLSTYHRKRRGAARARLRVAGHLSTTLRWGIPLSVFSNGTTSELDALLNAIPLMLNV